MTGKVRALVLTWSGYQDQEVIYPYYRLLGAGFDVDIVADQKDHNGRVFGILGAHVPCHLLFSDFELKWQDVSENYQLLVIPGGVKALEKLRIQKTAVDFVRHWNSTGKVIASTCHGAQLLISAGAVSGKRVAGYYSIEDDIRNAGGQYSKDPVVIDGNIVSSPHYDFMGEWMEATISEVNG